MSLGCPCGKWLKISMRPRRWLHQDHGACSDGKNPRVMTIYFILYYIIFYYIILRYSIYYLLYIIYYVLYIIYYIISYHIIHIYIYLCYICIEYYIYIHIATWMRENQHNRRWKLYQCCQVMRCQALQALKRQWTRWEAYFFIGQNSKLDIWVFINLCVKWNIDIAVWKSIRNSNTKITVSMIPRSPRDVFHLRNWTQIVLLSLQNRDIFHCEFSKVSQFLHRSSFPQQNPRLEQLS